MTSDENQTAGLSASSSDKESEVDWTAAFQSPTFVNALQNAIAKALPSSTTTASTSASTVPSTSTDSQPTTALHNAHVLTPPSGTLLAPSFIGKSGGVVQSGQANTLTNIQPPKGNTPLGVATGVSQGLSLDKAFILGPGRAPIPAKLVGQITSGVFVEMAELNPENLEEPPSEATTFSIEGSSIVPKTATRKKQEVTDILTWVECFNSYSAVLASYAPNRARDLLAYMALIIRTAKRFGGLAWRNYDRAFRREAAASGLQDWSIMKADLYNYHTASGSQGGATRSSYYDTQRERGFRGEARGDPRARELCISWNQGACISANRTCRYRHACSISGCDRAHRRIDHQFTSGFKRKQSPERHARKNPAN